MKKLKRIITIMLTFVMLLNIVPLFSFKAEAEGTQVFGEICPICGEKCGYSTEPRTQATCTEAAYVSVHCNTTNNFAWMQCGQPDPDRHGNTEYKNGKPATCTEAGYTDGEYCKDCGEWAYGHEYIAPVGHQWTDWAVIQPPTATADGQKIRTCSICEKNETAVIPAGTGSRFIKSVTLDDIQMNYKNCATLSPSIVSADGAKIKLTYTSSNPNVVSVNSNGNITALKTGTAVITVSAEDADGIITEDTCTVTVTYAWWQWIIKIVLLGFLWY